MKILNLYSSLNGQTQKVAAEIENTCKKSGYQIKTVNLGQDDPELDLLEYDITFIGSGVYTWLPGKKMLKWIERQLSSARDKGLILPNSPRVPGKFVCVYCTYAGPHTGEAEAVPAIKYMGQLFDHLGISIAAEWSIPGAFVPESKKALNISGRLGNIEGRPNAHDLQVIGEKTQGFIKSLFPVIEACKGK